MTSEPSSDSRHFGELRSGYQFDRVGCVPILIDSDRGRSVTHDANHVVRELSRSGDFRHHLRPAGGDGRRRVSHPRTR